MYSKELIVQKRSGTLAGKINMEFLPQKGDVIDVKGSEYRVLYRHFKDDVIILRVEEK